MAQLLTRKKRTHFLQLIQGVPREKLTFPFVIRSGHPSGRAAAHGARHLRPEQAEAVLLTLLDDDDPSVRKTTLQAAPAAPSPALLAKLNILREVEPEPMVRELATELFDRASRGGQ